jgi:hypothetical protein
MRIEVDPALRIYVLDALDADHDDVLLGESYNDVRINVAVYHGWDDDSENWTCTEMGWEAPSVDGDETWLMDTETGLPVGWSLLEISLEELE